MSSGPLPQRMDLFPRVAAVASVAVLLVASLVLVHGAMAPRGDLPRASQPISTDLSAIPAGTTTHPLAPTDLLTLSLSLERPHPSALSAYLAALNDRTSPQYHHYLTFGEAVSQFGPSTAAIQPVVAALREAGATSITVAPDRSSILVTLPVDAVESLLGVRMVTYGTDGPQPLFTAVGPVNLASGLAGRVASIQGLSDASGSAMLPTFARNGPARPWPAAAPAAGTPSGSSFLYDPSSNSQFFVGSDFTQMYGATDLFPGGSGSVANATYPTSIAVATLLASGFNASHGDLPPWDPAVVDPYFNDTFPSGWPSPHVYGVPETMAGDTPPAPGSFGGVYDQSLYEWENSLDLEMAGSLAPGASIYNFYFGGSLLNSSTATAGAIAGYFAVLLGDALNYSYGTAHLGVVSGSFGLPDLDSPAWDNEARIAATMGVTIVIASGDQGNAPDAQTQRNDGPWPTWPASAAFNSSGAIAVGGTSVTLTGFPTSDIGGNSVNLSYDPNDGAIGSMVAWYNTLDGPTHLAGTEGGISGFYPEPSWQFQSAAQWPIVNATETQGAGALGRAEPDVAFAANTTLATVYGVPNGNANETIYVAGLQGTSVAAPLFAGLLADVLAVEEARTTGGNAHLGFLDPTLYRIASYYAAHPSASASDPFLDVTQGSNYVFHASAGWDPLTGWGGIVAPLLLAALGNSTVSNYQYTGPTPGLPGSNGGSSGIPSYLYLVIGVGIAIAVAAAVAVLLARPRRPTGPVSVPYGASVGATYPPAPVAGSGPGATFVCPYCGTLRPAEPVRCPKCGAL